MPLVTKARSASPMAANGTAADGAAPGALATPAAVSSPDPAAAAAAAISSDEEEDVARFLDIDGASEGRGSRAQGAALLSL